MLGQIQMMVRRIVLGLVVMLAAMQFGLAQENVQQQVRKQVDLINEEVGKLYGQGKYGAALVKAKSAVALSERGLGPEHPDTGTSLNNLAEVHRVMGAYDKALPLNQRALAIAEKVQGPEHPYTGTRLNNLAALHESMGAYDKALPLYQRALAIAEKAQGPEHPDTGSRLNNLALLHSTMGAYAKALPLSQRALAIAEKAKGLEHPDTGASLNNLALLHESMGAYDKALPLYQRALAIAEKALGPEHPFTSSGLSNLAGLHKSMGAYDKALPLYQRALAIAEKAQGPEHPATSARLGNLAGLHESMGAYDKALPLYQRALAIAEKAQGPEHPDTGASVNNLAVLHQAMGSYAKALPLFQRALAVAEKAQGPEHPNTGSRLNNLAGLHESIGEYNKALPLYQRALAIAEKTQGPEHPDTGSRMNNLAELHRAMGAYDKALPLYQRALAIAEKAQGPKHPDTGTSLNNLALLHEAMGAYDKALPLFKRALAIAEQALGPEHPSTGSCLSNLAGLHYLMGAYDKALPLYQHALAIAEKTIGKEHPDTGARLNNLALLHEAMGAYDKALPLNQRALAIAERALGPEHPDTGTSLNNLAASHRAMGSYDKALPLVQRALAIAEKAQGAEHPGTAVPLSNLAGLHKSMGAYDKALPLYQRALAIAEKAIGPEHPDTGTHLNNLALLHEFMDAYDKALPLYQRAFAIAISRGGADPQRLANVAYNLCYLKQTTSRAEAIFYCKIAVNTRQKQRFATKAMSAELQRSFTKKAEDPYLLLNRLLSDSNPSRATEAAEVLQALKAAEFRAFTRDQGPSSYQISLTSSEAALNTVLQDAGNRLQQQQSAQVALKKEKASQAEIDRLDHPISIAKQHLHAAFAAIPARLKDSAQEAATQFKIDNSQFVRHLASLNAATPTEKSIILAINTEAKNTQITTYFDKQPLQLSLAIGMETLAPLINDMRAGIQAKNDTWRTPAKALYQLLIAPIEVQLAEKKLAPQNITLYLSGRLRTLPLAALLDANDKFLTEKYRLSLYTPGYGLATGGDWQRNWDINAFGSTLGKPEENLLALPGVVGELAAVARTTNTPQGVLPGDIYLGPNFSRKTWGQAVAGRVAENRRRVLHVATHFQLAENFYQSKLLLGDGLTFSAQELTAEQGLSLAHVDLITLSACETLLSKKSDSAEFENLGTLFQSKGANAVLGSLWPVADGGTAELMREFYKARGEQRAMSKAAALQSAQLAFLRGQVKAISPLDKKEVDVRHPYYWAAFVLMGNWL